MKITVELPSDVVDELDEMADETETTRDYVTTRMIDEWLRRRN